jgi:hypothetical protein
MLKEGIPSVVMVHEHFERLARTELKLLGIEDSSNVVIAYPADKPSAESHEEVVMKAHEQAMKLKEMLTTQKWQPQETQRGSQQARRGRGASSQDSGQE